MHLRSDVEKAVCSRSAIALAVLLLGALGLGCGMSEEPQRLHTSHAPPVPSGSISIEAREPFLPMFPCSRCHATRTPNPEERKLTEMHTKKVIEHGEQKGWCYRCHTLDDIDHLHIADGTKVAFNDAYELCGSCHGDKYRDWKEGLHGLTTGFWLGERVRRSCPNCHDPHSPKFPLMTPEHAPARPRTAPAQATEKSHVEAH